MFYLLIAMKRISPNMTKASKTVFDALFLKNEHGNSPICLLFLTKVGLYLTAAKVLKKSQCGKIYGANVNVNVIFELAYSLIY